MNIGALVVIVITVVALLVWWLMQQKPAPRKLQKLLFHLWIALSLSLVCTVHRLLVALANFLSVIVQHR